MITDDTFYDMAERLADDYDMHGDIRAITFTPDQFIKYSRELIALAQQVTPLEFERDDDGDYCARTAFGHFRIYTGRDFKYHFDTYKTLEEAVTAANEDYRRMVLNCLVNGGA